MKREFLVIIPARFAAARLPGKPLINIGGRPLLQHVYQAAVNSDAADVIIATDDERIEAAARGFAARVVMTSPLHRSGTDRLAEVVTRLQMPGDSIIVNVQGDELDLPPVLINQVAGNLAGHKDASMASLYAPVKSTAELNDPNSVKVVVDRRGYALLFSRSTIPWRAPAPAYGRQVVGTSEFMRIPAISLKPTRACLSANSSRRNGWNSYGRCIMVSGSIWNRQ